MKKILFVAFAATLLAAGCQKTEIINHVGDALTFSTGMGKLTKADDAGDLTTLKSQNFSVWAYYAADDQHTTGDDTHAVYGGIDNVVVSYGDNEKWGTTEQYYWPGVGKELIFFAVSADEATIGTKENTKVDIDDDRTYLTVNEFVVNPDEPIVDLMVADVVKQHQGDKVVDLKFHHTLSKVEFWFQTEDTGDDVDVVVKSLKVAGVSTKGTFSTMELPESVDPETKAVGDEVVEGEGEGEGENSNAGGTNNYQGTVNTVGFFWSSLSEPKEFTVANGKYVADAALTTTAVLYSNWLVIPQGIGDKTVEVVYTIGGKPFTSVFPLYTSSLTQWEPNQYVKYTITLAPNVISFNPSVDDWDDVVGSEMIN